MKDEMITPVRHNTLSGVGSTTAGTVGGALKSGVGTLLVTAALTAAAIGIGAVMLGAGPILTSILVVGGGLTAGTALGAFTGTFGALFGGIKGGQQAAQRVSQEKGAAFVMDAQVAAMQAQAQAQAATNIYAAPLNASNAKYNFPAAGTSMNEAAPQLDASTITNAGKINDLELARA